MNIYTLFFWLTDENHKVKPSLVLWVLTWVVSILAAVISFGRPEWLMPITILILYTIWRITYLTLFKIARVVGNMIYCAQFTQRAKPTITRVSRKAPEPDNTPWSKITATAVLLYGLIAAGLVISWNFDVLYWIFIVLGISGTEAGIVIVNINKSKPWLTIGQTIAFILVWFVAQSFSVLADSKAAPLMLLLLIANVIFSINIRIRAKKPAN